MNSKPNRSLWTRRSLVIVLTFATVICAYLPVQGLQEDAKFMTIEKDGAKMWQGGGTINLKAHGAGPLTFKVINTLTSEHGFAIDSMKVKEVIKPGQEKTIDVPLANIDKTVFATPCLLPSPSQARRRCFSCDDEIIIWARGVFIMVSRLHGLP